MMKIAEIVNAKQGLEQIFQQRGVPPKSLYWLERNWKSLEGLMKEWNGIVDNLFKTFCEKVGQGKYVPLDKYQAFKDEIEMLADADDVSLEELRGVFLRYEIEKPSMQTAQESPEFALGLNKLIEEEAKKYEREFEFAQVDLTPPIEVAFGQCVGIAYLATQFMFKEPSPIELPESVISFPQRMN